MDVRLAIWQVGFYLAQMTSWILPWPNDKLAWPNDKLDFTLTKWQVGFYLNQMTSCVSTWAPGPGPTAGGRSEGPGPKGPGPGGWAGIFVKTKKNRSEIVSGFPAVARLDLSYVSENGGKRLSPNTHFQIFKQCKKQKHSAYLYLANSVNHRGGAKQIIAPAARFRPGAWAQAGHRY